MNTNYVGLSECPYCSEKIDSAINDLNEMIPAKVGNIALCIRCGEASEFDEEMKLIKFNVSRMNAEDLMNMRKNQLVIAQFHYKETKLQ